MKWLFMSLLSSLNSEEDLNLVSVYAGASLVISQPGKHGRQPGKVLQQSRAFCAAGRKN
jgi:hypothetical protein